MNIPGTKKTKQRIWNTIKLTAAIYALLGIALYYAQDAILFQATPLAQSHVYKFKVPYKQVFIPLNKTDSISLVKFFTNNKQPRGVILYFHGNKQNVEHYQRFIGNFLNLGYEVWMPDYFGYGKSTGERTEEKLYSMAYQVQRLAAASFADSNIIVYGKSLGTGLAAYVAANTPNRMLILETPYYDIPDIFRSYAWMYPLDNMIQYKIPTYQFLQDVKVPVTIFHGTADGVIRYRSADKLRRFLKPTDRFFTIKGGTHHSVRKTYIYNKVIDSLLR